MKRYLLTLVMMGWQLMAFAAVSVEINPSSVQLGVKKFNMCSFLTALKLQ